MTVQCQQDLFKGHDFLLRKLRSNLEKLIWFATVLVALLDAICLGEFDSKDEGFFHPAALADYLTWVRTPEMIRGMCEDYRAAATIDLVHDRVSRAAELKIACPLHVLWGANGKIGAWYEPLDIWRRYCSGPVTGRALPTGHYLAEESPAMVTAELLRFFA